MTLTPIAERFILHWGEMGSRWGVNRTVAQIHALLYLLGRPVPAEEIAETLGVARSNVSNSLKELQAWRLARVVHVMDDRRDHFETSTDIWELFKLIVDVYKRQGCRPWDSAENARTGYCPRKPVPCRATRHPTRTTPRGSPARWCAR